MADAAHIKINTSNTNGFLIVRLPPKNSIQGASRPQGSTTLEVYHAR
jgi:hypothetical protein